MSWTLRTGRLSDIDSVLALWVESGAEPTHTDDVESLATLIERDPWALLVAVHDGAVIGTVIAAWDGWRGSIYRLVVSPAHRRQGLARRLLQESEVRLCAMGAVRLQAIVVESESNASDFWRASGWERQVQRARFVRG